MHRLRSSRAATALVPLAPFLPWIASCGPKPFVIGEYNYPGTPVYTCQAPAANSYGNCDAGQSKTDETQWNQSGTVRIPLHAPVFGACPTGIQRILVKDPSSPNTQVIVECAPPPINVGTAGPGPAAAPAPPARR
jgi:hypothetical protein